MIKNASVCKERFEKSLRSKEDFLSEKMLREYKCFKDRDLSNFYMLGDIRLMVMGENISVRGDITRPDLDQILSFARFMGIYGLESRQDNLPVKSRNRFNLMEYRGADEAEQRNIVKNGSIYSFSQFCRANFTGSAFETIYSYFAGKVNRGLSDIYCLEEDGKIISAALATQYTSQIYITFVSTRAEKRGLGLASKVIKHILSQRGDKSVILMCEDELVPFYEKLEFCKMQDIYLYTLREEKI